MPRINTSCLSMAIVPALFMILMTPYDSLSATWTQKGGSLSVDVSGWAQRPAIASSQDGSIYVAWTQHRNPSINEYSGVYVKRWVSGGWETLGGRIGHVLKEDNAIYPEAYSPSVAILGNTPYVAWYEGGGYGWSSSVEPSVFVAHWDGIQWVYDKNSGTVNGALNTSPSYDGRNPVLAVSNGQLLAAWIEHRPVGNYNVVVAKRLENGLWVPTGPEIAANPVNGSRILDLALAVDGSGSPYLAWTEFLHKAGSASVQNSPGAVHLFKLAGDKWTRIGTQLNFATGGYVNYLSMVISGITPQIAWQERPPSGNFRIYFALWDGGKWVRTINALNVDATTGEAGRPGLASDGTRAWLAWAEGPPGQKSQLYVRSFAENAWSAAEGGLNTYPLDGASDSPAITVSGGVPQIAHGERHFPSGTKQVYVKGRDTTGTPSTDKLVRYGANGPAAVIPPNTWISMKPGGIYTGSAGVGDEGFSSFAYSPAVRKALVFGKYHAVGVAEEQNALLSYDFQTNRFDLVEVTEDAWSEHLPGIGHDLGAATVDPIRGTYITHGNLTLNSGTAFHTYAYDLRAGRGKRMMPPIETSLNGGASSFDTDRGLMFTVGASPTSWLYDPDANIWDPVANGPTRYSPGLTYDSKNKVFVLFGGNVDGLGSTATKSNETWTFNPATRTWKNMQPSVSPLPKYSPYLAFDSANGVVMMTGGSTSEVWIYDTPTNKWTQLPNAPAIVANLGTGAYLTYNSDDQLFLLDSWSERNVYAFRLDMGNLPPPPPPSTVKQPSPPLGITIK